MLTVDEINPVLAWPFESSDLLLPNRMEGKVRDWYDLPQNRRLLITTDRLSAFDRNLALVPFKVRYLTSFPHGGLKTPRISSPITCLGSLTRTPRW